ncbi:MULTISPECIES: isopropylmalate isomerase [Ruegeria]|uniref:Isopropylmalate isomerase n=2 Tax=Ruegeria TaxID=97050 RepID=A0A6B2NTI4_9RHOB|nr:MULTISPECIES: isopropylmalate isomerase [unclassified Ruegeria]MCU9836144.1 isopropylmalate isomerase [Ruegeria sp. WL0004]NDW45799.1 isopropylmalate isomerase [Ruegeria sp. PrR005]
MKPYNAPNMNLQDRARLRERFFGATRSVLARL